MSSGTCAVADKYTAEEILRAAQVSGSAADSALHTVRKNPQFGFVSVSYVPEAM
jgi:hypothetical protein